MNIFRFLGKCLFDPPAAARSARLVGRSLYGRWYWRRHPHQPFHYRLPAGGSLLLEPEHSFTRCFWPGVDAYEPEIASAIMRLLKTGDTFVDCGANIGYFSVMAGKKVGPAGRVLSVEANPETYRLLQRNLEANGFGKALHCALTSQPGEVELFMPMGGGDVYSSLRADGLAKDTHMRSFKVQGRTLDEIVAAENLEAVNLIKIDVEGGELDVLAAAGKTVERFQPIVLIEYSTNTWPAFGATPERLRETAERWEYGLYQILDDGSFRPADDAVWQKEYVNIALLPAERATGAS